MTILPRPLVILVFVMACALALAPPSSASPMDAGSQLWASQYNGPGSSTDKPAAMVVSPDGATVFVTGFSYGLDTGTDFVTIAYDRSTGLQKWVARYDGQGSPDDNDNAVAIAVSPEGGTVFVTGPSGGTGTLNYATVAYEAATGTQVWLTRETFDSGLPSGVAVSPDGGTVFVTGVGGINLALNDITIAYDAATGAQQWQSAYTNPGLLASTGLVVSPDGSRVNVVGKQSNARGDFDIFALSYDASHGHQQYVSTYANSSSNIPNALALSPDGSRLFVTGYTGPLGVGHGLDALTVAFDTSTGATLWSATFNGHAGREDYANAVTVNPAGTKVYVAGTTVLSDGRSSYLAASYDASTGEQLRLASYTGPADGLDVATGIAMSPEGATVFVTGWSAGTGTALDFATVAYTARNLRQLWVSRFDDAEQHEDRAVSIAVTPDGRRVLVTGFSGIGGDGFDIETVSYQA